MGGMKKSKPTEVRRKMKNQNNKPIERIKEGRISLLKWENSNRYGELFTSFSLNKTVMKRSEDDPSKFEGQVFSLNGLTKKDLKDTKELIEEMMEAEEEEEAEGWSQ
jgi:hypothetical protein